MHHNAAHLQRNSGHPLLKHSLSIVNHSECRPIEVKNRMIKTALWR